MARSGNGTTDNIISSGFTAPSNFTIHIMYKGTATPGSASNNKVCGLTDSGYKGIDFNWNHTNASFRQAWGIYDGGWKAAKYTTSLAANTPYALQCTYDGTNLRAYLDGVLEDTQAASSLSVTGDVTAVVMDSPDGSSTLPGEYADFAVWSVPLNADELIALKRGKSPHLIRPESLVLNWPIWGRHSPEIDLSPTGNNGTLDGTTVVNHPSVGLFTPKLVSNPIVDPIFSGARKFNGDTDKIDCGSSSPIGTDNTTMTIIAAVHPTAVVGSVQHIVGRNQNSSSNVWRLNVRGTDAAQFQMTFSGGVAHATTANSTLSTDNWNFIAATIDATTVKIYHGTSINGIVDATSTSNAPSGSHTNSPEPVTIGNGSDDLSGFVGDLGKIILIQGSALSLGEIKGALIKAASILPDGWWPLLGNDTPEPDWSSNSNNGTVTGTDIANGPSLPLFTPRWAATYPQIIEVAGGFQAAWARNSNQIIGIPL